jgi:integrase
VTQQQESSQTTRKPVVGISPRHQRGCPASGWQVCRCSPSYRAEVYDKRAKRKIRQTFPTLAAAKRWREDAKVEVRHKRLIASKRETFNQAGPSLIEGMEAGTIRDRSGKQYKASTRRTYQQDLDNHVLPEFGPERLDDITRSELQAWANTKLAEGYSPSKVRNMLLPVRVLYRERIDSIPVNPTVGLRLPVSEGMRDRIASPEEAVKLIGALPSTRDRAILATAFYAGLRSGELEALGDEDVSLEESMLRVRRSWDKVEGLIETKTKAGKREVFVCNRLRPYLERYVESDEYGRGGFFFGSRRPFDYWGLVQRAKKVWKAAGLEAIGLHSCRHSFRSWLDAVPAISEVRADRYCGHSVKSMRTRYTHTLDGQLAKDAAALDEYLSAAESGTLIQLRREAS